MKNKTINEMRQRVIALLTREQLDFLDKLGKDAFFTTGHKLTHTKIVSYSLDLLISLGLDGKNIKSYEDLENKAKEAIMKKIIASSLTPSKEESVNAEKMIEIKGGLR